MPLLKWKSAFSIIVIATAIDQATKYMILTRLPSEGFFIIPNLLELRVFFHISFLEMFVGPTLVGVVILAVLTACLAGWRYMRSQSKMSRQNVCDIGMSLFIGGALGNALDRLRVGAVIDWIHVSGLTFFNLADFFILLGACLISIFLFLKNSEAIKTPV